MERFDIQADQRLIARLVRAGRGMQFAPFSNLSPIATTATGVLSPQALPRRASLSCFTRSKAHAECSQCGIMPRACLMTT